MMNTTAQVEAAFKQIREGLEALGFTPTPDTLSPWSCVAGLYLVKAQMSDEWVRLTVHMGRFRCVASLDFRSGRMWKQFSVVVPGSETGIP